MLMVMMWIYPCNSFSLYQTFSALTGYIETSPSPLWICQPVSCLRHGNKVHTVGVRKLSNQSGCAAISLLSHSAAQSASVQDSLVLQIANTEYHVTHRFPQTYTQSITLQTASN